MCPPAPRKAPRRAAGPPGAARSVTLDRGARGPPLPGRPDPLPPPGAALPTVRCVLVHLYQ